MILYNITIKVNDSLYYLHCNKKYWLHELGPREERGKWRRKIARFHETMWRIRFNRWIGLKKGPILSQTIWRMGKKTITITEASQTDIQNPTSPLPLPSIPDADKEEKPREQLGLFPYSL